MREGFAIRPLDVSLVREAFSARDRDDGSSSSVCHTVADRLIR